MTPADHAALSAQLARALGYYPESVRILENLCIVYRIGVSWRAFTPINVSRERWAEFDYRDPSVALPVLEWLMKEHWCFVTGPIPSIESADHMDMRIQTDTLPEAIARAAIAVAEEGRKRVEQNEDREVLQS